MCRFVVYMGKQSVAFSEVLEKPENSLINQSRAAREGKTGLNADGFGLGWYNFSVDEKPGLFKSVQPAWNDENLRHTISKIQSDCFIGHVRASTVGDVNTYNCHPFAYNDLMFCHNGTIRDFDKIKRSLLSSLSDSAFNLIKGQTDSEHLFALIVSAIQTNRQLNSLSVLVQSVEVAFSEVNYLQSQDKTDAFSKINAVLTNGKEIVATRYVSDEHEDALSLFYATGRELDHGEDEPMLVPEKKEHGAIIIASEPLNDYYNEWHEVPVNHMLLVDQNLNVSFRQIQIS